ncbi:MAG TPA: ABC transporter permease subunit, partial [Isosphaeraceae bacterium]
MSAFVAMVRRRLAESRWFLGISTVALFGLSWLFVYATARIEARMQQAGDARSALRRAAFLRGIGGEAMDFSSPAIEVAFWNHPFIPLILAVWAVSRGSAAVAGELERGQLDLVLSRPVSRASYLGAHVVSALIGLAVLSGALIAGNRSSSLYNTVHSPPGVLLLARPALNYAALGLAIYGYSVLLSALDSVRWRPNLLASVLTLGGYIALIVANIPALEEWYWKELEKVSIFKAYNPVDAVVNGETLGFHLLVLTGLGV